MQKAIALPGLGDLQAVKPKFEPGRLLDPILTILKNPRTCWQVFRSNGKSFQSVFEDYVFVLAAIPSICGFIGNGLLGHTGIIRALLLAITCYLLSVAFLYGAAYLAHKTAQMFDGAVSLDQSGKLVVYSMMPFFFAGSFLMIPPLALLSLLGAASIYLFVTGIEVMTDIAKEKRLTYGMINVVAWLVGADLLLSNIF